MVELKPCKHCGKKPHLYPFVVKTVLKDASQKHKGNIYKIKAERIEIPVFYTVSCNSEKCKRFLHKNPAKIISEDSVNGAILKWNQRN